MLQGFASFASSRERLDIRDHHVSEFDTHEDFGRDLAPAPAGDVTDDEFGVSESRRDTDTLETFREG